MSMLKWFAALALVLLLVQPCIAGDLAPIVGIWKLVSFEREYQAGGEREYPMGKAPTGYILFLPEGRMTVVITGEGRKAPNARTRIAWVFSTPWSRTPVDTAWTETSGSRQWMCPEIQLG